MSDEELLHLYVPSPLLTQVRDGLLRATVARIPDISSPANLNGKAFAVNEARREVAGQLSQCQLAITGFLNRLTVVYTNLSRRQFNDAETAIKDLKPELPPELPDISIVEAGRALTRLELTYLTRGFPEEEEDALPGYAGPDVNPSDVVGLFGMRDLAGGGGEFEYRKRLLSAECRSGLRRFGDAITLYAEILSLAGLSPERRQFVALRSGSAHLGLGDALFRKSRNPDPSDQVGIRAAYNAAVDVVGNNAISADNPLRQQIEQYAAMQTGKLDAGFNFLGYHDGYVPTLRIETLQRLAERRIQAADEATKQLRVFELEANRIQDQLIDLNFDRDIKEVELALTGEQVLKANDQVRIASAKVEIIQTQLDSLDSNLAGDLLGVLLKAFASAAADGVPVPKPDRELDGGDTHANTPDVAGALSGGISAFVGYSARKTDLEFQQKIARIEEGIANRDVTIARLGRQIAEMTAEFLGEKVRRIQNRELNPDLYYAAGEAFRAMAERDLDAAILWSYLFERAVAFRRMRPNLSEIRFDHVSDQPESLFTAPGALHEDLTRVVERNVPDTKFQVLTETYSLRSLFPLEFSGFLQTGRMDFDLSLYELGKRRPGVYGQRIKNVQVELQFPPPSGFTGRIRHRGSFLLRDKDTTPEPGADPKTGPPFVPSGGDLQDAIAKLGPGATQGIPINGVIPFIMDVDTIELSPDQSLPDQVNADPDALVPIEGYGSAGNWTLEIENVDLRTITEALLRITYLMPESDELLGNKVKGLIKNYEVQLLNEDALDLISPLSLRQRFPDTLAQLGTGIGTAQFTVARDDFPTGITDLKLKTLVVQALDANRKGVAGLELELSKLGTPFDLKRITQGDGFTEDVTAKNFPVLPVGQRVNIEGTYALQVTDPSAFTTVDDLLVFFIYEFHKV